MYSFVFQNHFRQNYYITFFCYTQKVLQVSPDGNYNHEILPLFHFVKRECFNATVLCLPFTKRYRKA